MAVVSDFQQKRYLFTASHGLLSIKPHSDKTVNKSSRYFHLFQVLTLFKGTLLNIVQIVTLDSTNQVAHVRYNVTKQGQIVVALSMSKTEAVPTPPSESDLTYPNYCPPLPQQ